MPALLAAAGLPLIVWVAAWYSALKREQGSRTPNKGETEMAGWAS
jgi:hypothetical protein